MNEAPSAPPPAWPAVIRREVLDILRSGAWLSRARMRFVAWAVLVASLIGFGYLVATAHDSVDVLGRPLGTDFSNIYAAGTYVLEGKAAAPFDPALQHAREQAIFGQDTPFYGWHYPPFLLFVAGTFALVPYGLALAAWQIATFLLYLLMIRAILAAAGSGEANHQTNLIVADRLWLLLASAFPAVFINLGHGHNGFLTAALIGGGLVLLDRRPAVAGILFGLLAYKPQFGLLIPLVLATTGRWRAFASAVATVALLVVACTLAFGPEVWEAFLASASFTRRVVLEAGNTGWHKIQSVFSWVRMWGGTIALAYALQAAVTIVSGAALVWLWRSAAPFALKAAALCMVAILATPYSLDYDMMVLAPAIAFFAADGLARGFGPWEKTALAALWLVPLVARSVTLATFIPLGVWSMLAVLVALLRRAATDPDRQAPALSPGARRTAAE